MTAAIIGLYVLNLVSAQPLNEALLVSPLVVALAGTSAIVCIILFFAHPKSDKINLAATIFAFWLITAAIASLIMGSGGPSSIFIALWLIVCVFAGIFGVWGWLPVLIVSAGFLAIEYMQNNLNAKTSIIIAVSSVLPLILGIIIWSKSNKDDPNNSDNRSYRNLANELSAVASKSEVVINAIGDGVIAVDGKGVIQLINPAAQRIIGWGKQDALGLDYKSILHLIDKNNNTLDPLIDPIQQVLNTNQQIRTNDFSLETNSGKHIIISLVASPVGEMGSGIIIVFHDITKEKADEREQAEFISTASHEMRTPVASIEGYLGLVLNPQTAQIDQRARDFVLKAHASAEHLGRLFQDLLDISKADDGRLSNNPKVVNLVALAYEIVQGLMPRANASGLRLVYVPIPEANESSSKVVPPVFSVNLDNDHIREVLDNLIENAIKYTKSGEILVDVTGNDDNVIISVKDNGIGIPTEDIPHLFQKFYRVDNKDTRSIGGTGLGLYLSRRLVEIMGGRIWVESTYGRGSTFFVELPRISNQEAARLTEQETLINEEEAKQKVIISQTQASNTQPTTQVIRSRPMPIASSVPRSSSLTPEQIAAYAARQHAMAAAQAKVPPSAPANYQQPTYPPTVPIYSRDPRK